jgi:3'-phosphoadenosine 5'-phosphosulfate sulfotransferase (PAPS reductase)/FAD synthetase
MKNLQGHDPFKINSPTCISFSGGRTSAYMLWCVLKSNGGKLPDEAIVCFANTGKEDEATLQFVRDCSVNWNVPITWIEYQTAEETADRWRMVDFNTASRNGEPFAALIADRNFLPNPVARFCTVEMKVLSAARHLWALGWTEWDNYVGLRADEPYRTAKLKANPSGGTRGIARFAPLATAGVAVAEVGAFWAANDFDLRLPNSNGKTMHGNCDLCFLKSGDQVLSLIREEPARATWWIAMENSITNPKITNGGTFRSDRPSYSEMHRMATHHGELFAFDDTGLEDCACTD